MSARRRKPLSPELDYARGGIELAKLRAWSILVRYQQIVGDGHVTGKPVNVTAHRRRGRPNSDTMQLAIADYLFETLHYKDLREAGYGNVPPDKQALDIALARHFPEALESPAELEKARRALKAAIQRRRVKHRA